MRLWTDAVRTVLTVEWKYEAEVMLELASLVTPERAIAAARRESKRSSSAATRSGDLALDELFRRGVRIHIQPALAELLKAGVVERDGERGRRRWRINPSSDVAAWQAKLAQLTAQTERKGDV